MPPKPDPDPTTVADPVAAPTLSSGLRLWFVGKNNEWKSGTFVQFQPKSNQPHVLIAADDGTFAWVEMDHVRHGDKPTALPKLYSTLPGGIRQHTLKLHNNNWLLARPDGRVLKEYPDDEQGMRDAHAHYAKLEPEAAKREAAEAAAKKTA
jgi:hypothetical protein